MPQHHQRRLHRRSSFGSSPATSDVESIDTAHYHPRRRRVDRPSQIVPTSRSQETSSNGKAYRAVESEAPRTTVDRRSEESTVLVAVRCRPRKRRRDENRAAAAVRRTRSLDRVRTRQRRDDRFIDTSDDSDASMSSDDEFDDDREGDLGSGRRLLDFSMPVGGSTLSTKPQIHVNGLLHRGAAGVRRSFEFDHVFPPWTKQSGVYDACVEDQIARVLRQLPERVGNAPAHATIVAYGQTGTGKTYTMGMLSDLLDRQERGIIPRAFDQVLQHAAEWNRRAGGEDNTCRGQANCRRLVTIVSFIQIYLETVQDLLLFPADSHDAWDRVGPSAKKARDLPVRQKSNRSFYVDGLSEYEVRSMRDVRLLLETAARNRVLASTTKNKTSSRSHTLLTISLKFVSSSDRDTSCSSSSCSRASGNQSDDEDDDEMFEPSTISFVDLAGSERVDGALHFLRATRRRQELRIREAKFINRSLSALGNVIAALALPAPIKSSSAPPMTRPAPHQPDPYRASYQHIRFRDSQLTKLLQSRLTDGRGRLLLIATVDDRPEHLAETLSTLKFAAQCRRVELRGQRTDNTVKLKDMLLKQALQDMKVMYEDRETELHVR